MFEQLWVPFEYGYMVRLIGVAGLIGVVCGVLSCFVTLKGWSLMGDAVSHAVVPGVAIAGLVGWPFAVGAFVSGMASVVVMGLVKATTRLREDAVLGLVYTTFFAGGILLISMYPTNVNLKSVVMGNLMGIADRDIIQMVVVSVAVLGVLAVRWKDLILYIFDPAQAVATGRSRWGLHWTLLMLLAGTTVAALQAVGVILVVAMLITPGATAYLLTDRFNRMALIAGAVGLLTSMTGAYLSYFLDASAGGSIVVLQTIVFLLALFLAPRHGVLAARMRRWTAQREVTA